MGTYHISERLYTASLVAGTFRQPKEALAWDNSRGDGYKKEYTSSSLARN